MKLLEIRTFVSFLGASLTGLALYFRFPFPEMNLFLNLIRVRELPTFYFLKYSYVSFLFTTPFFAYSLVTSFLYMFFDAAGRKKTPSYPLPPYSDPSTRESLYLVIGEMHNPKKPVPAENPHWLVIPARGLFTGIAMLGAIGSGKTSGSMYPFVYQLLAFRADDPSKRIGGLVLEVKGDFCHKVRMMLRDLGREKDYVDISLNSDYCYNPFHNDLDAYALAYGVASLLTNLFGRGKEPFWQQAYTNLVKFVILLHKVLYDYVTLFDVYECAINRELLEAKIQEGEKLFAVRSYLLVEPGSLPSPEELGHYQPTWDKSLRHYRLAASPELQKVLEEKGISFTGPFTETSLLGEDSFKREQFEAIKRWFYHDWSAIDQKLRTSIVEGISVFLSLFDDNPKVKRIFCPPKQCYDPQANHDYRYGRPLPGFAWLIEEGRVCALNFPASMNPGLARALGTLLKMDFQRAVLNRIPQMEEEKDRHFREVFFLCDEYHQFATTGENDPNGDEKVFSLSRQAKLIPIVATQSVSSLKTALYGESYRTLLQTFRTKIFLALSDDVSTRFASELCGKEDKLKVSYHMSESSQNAKVSFLFGKTLSDKATLSTSKSYNVQRDFIFDQNVFAQLKNQQSITLAFDGVNPLSPCYCYLKPYYLDPNKSYFRQLEDGEI
jgi:hypothetical protein